MKLTFVDQGFLSCHRNSEAKLRSFATNSRSEMCLEPKSYDFTFIFYFYRNSVHSLGVSLLCSIFFYGRITKTLVRAIRMIRV